MSATPLDDAELLRAAFARAGQSLRRAEARAEMLLGGTFVAAAAALWAASGARPPSLPIATLYVVAIAVTTSIRFNAGIGFTVPVQVVFVPMLFAMPAGHVPALVAAGFVVAHLAQVARGEARSSRVFLCAGNAWFSIGPAAVLLATGISGPEDGGLLLPLVLVAQFAGDFAAAAVRERITNGLSLAELVAEVRAIYAIDLALSTLGLLVAYATSDQAWSVVLVGPLLVLLTVFSRERRMRLEQVIELNDAYRGTALVLGDVIEADDAYTGEHTRGVVGLATAVAVRLGLTPHERRTVEFGALLHDVGKVAIPKEIINKPGKLDDHEWTIIKAHTIEGQRMLDRVGGLMQEVGHVVRSSHERWDGQGYPDGLCGHAIPLEARIVSACDAFNAMTTTRSYRDAMTREDAVAELCRNAGSQFDPRVVEALLAELGAAHPPSVMLAPA